MEQQRLLLAISLSLLLLVAYQELVVRRYHHQPAPQGEPVTMERPAAPATPAPTPTTTAAPAKGLAAPVAGEPTVSVETDVLRATLTTSGARLLHLELKSYLTTVARNSGPLDLVREAPVLPGTLALDKDSSDAGLRYAVDRPSLVVRGDERGEVVFTTTTASGLRLEKRYTFTGANYLFDVTANLAGPSAPSRLGIVMTPMPPEGPKGAAGETAVSLVDSRLVQKSLADLLKGSVPLEDPAWAGFATQYFLSAVFAATETAHGVMATADELPVVRLDAPVVDGRAAFVVYTGPKDREVLARAGHGLDRALDFGWFWFVAVPLLYALRFLHGLTGNYGVAIIVLTALVKVVTIPLTRTTFRNMREMQKIQPQMTKLRERFKDDSAALQKEMMELYRRHRVNPLSGCLPMVLQLPIFVGLYNALSHAIELRHAPFAFWIQDLSAPEWLMIAGHGVPVLTILMGASMFVQQWLTPAQGDPAQQRMMMFMPIVFTFMFINFPAGLVLYWLVNNVLTIGQQYLMMRSAP